MFFPFVYFQVLRGDLIEALRRKRPQPDLDDVILHHDNAPAHRAHDSDLDIDLICFSLLPHLLYSPDLAPWTFVFFLFKSRNLEANGLKPVYNYATSHVKSVRIGLL